MTVPKNASVTRRVLLRERLYLRYYLRLRVSLSQQTRLLQPLDRNDQKGGR